MTPDEDRALYARVQAQAEARHDATRRAFWKQRFPWAVRVERHPNDDPRWMTPRREWGDGPWQNEPDVIEWRRAGSGLPCLIVRAGTGALCGYVGLPPVHPDWGKHYGSLEVEHAHGGLTFSDYCAGHICHVPREGETAAVWWVGFDCAHFMDASPAMDAMTRTLREQHAAMYAGMGMEAPSLGTYRTRGYVKAHVELLADELSERGPENLSRERWWWWHVALVKQLVLQDFPAMWRSIYLEQNRYGWDASAWKALTGRQAPWD